MIFVALALGVPAGFVFAHAVRVPTVKSLEDYTPAIITLVFDRNGIPFAEYSIQRRIIVPKREMAPALVNAIIATEDADFYKHGGISPKAILRAGLKDLIAGRKVEGASIAGISNRPGAYSPILNPVGAQRRRDHVLRRMLEVKYITRPQFQQAISTPVVLGSYKEESPKIG